MNNEPSSHVSALFDGEQETHEVAAGLRDISDNGARWREYALIGDGLRGERTFLACDISASVMAQLSAQPVVLAPRNLQTKARKPHPLLALAASVAGVAVVGWLALAGGAQPSSDGPSPLMTQLERAALASVAVPPAPTFVPSSQVASVGDLTAHRVPTERCGWSSGCLTAIRSSSWVNCRCRNPVALPKVSRCAANECR